MNPTNKKVLPCGNDGKLMNCLSRLCLLFMLQFISMTKTFNKVCKILISNNNFLKMFHRTGCSETAAHTNIIFVL